MENVEVQVPWGSVVLGIDSQRTVSALSSWSHAAPVDAMILADAERLDLSSERDGPRVRDALVASSWPMLCLRTSVTILGQDIGDGSGVFGGDSSHVYL